MLYMHMHMHILSGDDPDDAAALGWNHGPDVIVLNSGAHDINSAGFTLTKYASRLRAVWALLKVRLQRTARPMSPPPISQVMCYASDPSHEIGS